MASTALAAELQKVPMNKTVKEIVTQQCKDVGGTFTIVCHCGTQRDPLAVSLAAVALVKDKKINSQTLGVINPFVEVCTQGMDLQSGLIKETVASRLADILAITNNSVISNSSLMDEIDTLIKIGYLDLDSVLKYITDDKYKVGVKNRLAEIKEKLQKAQANFASNSNLAQDAQARTKNFLKLKAIEDLNTAVGFDIQAAQKVFMTIRAQLPPQSHRMNRDEAVKFIESLRANSKEMAKNLGHTVFSNAKSGITGVVRGAVIASAAQLTGFNLEWLSYLDPINVFIQTVTPVPALAHTRTQVLAMNPTTMYDVTNFVLRDSTQVYLRNNVNFVRDAGEAGMFNLFAQRVMMVGLYVETRQKALGEGTMQLTSIAAMMAE